MRFFYTITYYLLIPFLLIRLLWRSRYTADYRKRWNERFGFGPVISDKNSIWVHAVSVGETLAAIPFIKALLQQYGKDFHIIVTTTTPTGSALVTKNLGDSVLHTYAPFDVPTAVSRFLKRSRVALCIIMETEVWPNILTHCHRKNIPIILANARLSEHSYIGYKFIGKLTRQMLATFHTVAAQGVLDGERFLQLGLDPKKLIITGNIKFDLHIPVTLITEGRKIRQEIGLLRPVLIAASTHDGEEAAILSAFEKIRAEIPDIFLILAPRHPDRFQKVLDLCTRYSVTVRSQRSPILPTTDILLINTIGELQMIFAAADIAFVGGSLVPVGGHNLIEPAALGLPVLTGPHLHNFTDIGQLLRQAGAAQIVVDSKAIADAVIALLSAKDLREKIGRSARETIDANRGALQKHLECVAKCLETFA